jgi:hypothetical protein
MIAMTLGSVLGSFLAGQAVSLTGRYRPLTLLGSAVAAAMCLFVAWFGLGHSLLVDSVVTLALGLSFGCSFSPITVTIQNALAPQDSGIGISCMMFFRLMGGAFGVAFLSSLLLGALPAGAAGAVAEPAFAMVFEAAAVIAGLSLVAGLLLREIPLRGRE